MHGKGTVLIHKSIGKSPFLISQRHVGKIGVYQRKRCLKNFAKALHQLPEVLVLHKHFSH